MAGETFYLEIDLKAIGQDQIHFYTKRNGEEGAKLRLLFSSLKQKDQFGNTHTAYIYRTKQEREAGVPVVYVGKGHKMYGDGSSYQSGPAKEDSEEPF